MQPDTNKEGDKQNSMHLSICLFKGCWDLQCNQLTKIITTPNYKLLNIKHLKFCLKFLINESFFYENMIS